MGAVDVELYGGFVAALLKFGLAHRLGARWLEVQSIEVSRQPNDLWLPSKPYVAYWLCSYARTARQGPAEHHWSWRFHRVPQ